MRILRFTAILAFSMLLFSCNNNSIPKATPVKIEILSVSDVNFTQEVVDEQKLVVVDFWAPWCGPCKDINRIMKELSTYFPKEQVKFVKLNVDENILTKQNYGVVALPTIMIFKEGEVVHKQMGLTTREHVRYKIQQNL